MNAERMRSECGEVIAGLLPGYCWVVVVDMLSIYCEVIIWLSLGQMLSYCDVKCSVLRCSYISKTDVAFVFG